MIAHRSVEIALYYAIKSRSAAGALFPLHGAASRAGFIGLLTDSSGECIRGENVNSPADSAARVYTTNTNACARTCTCASTIRLTTVGERSRKVVSYYITTSIKTNHKAHYGRSSNYRSIYPAWWVEANFPKLSYIPMERSVR